MKQKVLLMGRSGSGKTSMRSIIFANYVAQDTSRLGATMEVEHSNVRFLGDLVLNLWDCGGQENFMNNYFESQRGHIFRGVKVLIYVFDLDSNDHRQEVKYFKDCIQALSENSADAQIFALLHKMDLVPEGKQASTRDEYEKEVRTIANPFSVECFATSIWDETLYRAWSTIVHQLIPNSQRIETMLEQFRSVCEAEEVVLFESATFLVISQAASTSHPYVACGFYELFCDVHRFEKISNIVKQFKLSCAKSQAQCDEMVVRNASFTAFVHRFTSNTYVMVVTTDKAILPTATAVNIGIAKAHFEKTLSATGATAESSA